jgi:hypothetical protein
MRQKADYNIFAPFHPPPLHYFITTTPLTPLTLLILHYSHCTSHHCTSTHYMTALPHIALLSSLPLLSSRRNMPLAWPLQQPQPIPMLPPCLLQSQPTVAVNACKKTRVPHSRSLLISAPTMCLFPTMHVVPVPTCASYVS